MGHPVPGVSLHQLSTLNDHLRRCVARERAKVRELVSHRRRMLQRKQGETTDSGEGGGEEEAGADDEEAVVKSN